MIIIKTGYEQRISFRICSYLLMTTTCDLTLFATSEIAGARTLDYADSHANPKHNTSFILAQKLLRHVDPSFPVPRRHREQRR